MASKTAAGSGGLHGCPPSQGTMADLYGPNTPAFDGTRKKVPFKRGSPQTIPPKPAEQCREAAFWQHVSRAPCGKRDAQGQGQRIQPVSAQPGVHMGAPAVERARDKGNLPRALGRGGRGVCMRCAGWGECRGGAGCVPRVKCLEWGRHGVKSLEARRLRQMRLQCSKQ
jgi:hypothetical protein